MNLGKMLLSDYAIIGYELVVVIILLVFIIKLSKLKKAKLKEQEKDGIRQKEETLKHFLSNENRR